MCRMCENPSMTRDDYLAEIRDLILRRGWAVQFVGGTRVRAPFAYTVGLTEMGLPELLVTGLSMPRAGAALNGVAGHLLHAEPPTAGQRGGLRDGFSYEVVEVAEPSAHLFVACLLYGDDISARQLVWRDDRGRWPWDVGHRAGRGGQPVLGRRAAQLGH